MSELEDELYGKSAVNHTSAPGTATSLFNHTGTGDSVKLGAATPDPVGGLFGAIGSGAPGTEGLSGSGSYFGNMVRAMNQQKAEAAAKAAKEKEAEEKKAKAEAERVAKEKLKANQTQNKAQSTAAEASRQKRIRTKATERAKKRVGSTYDYKAGQAHKTKIIKKETDRHMKGDLKDTL